MPEALLMKALAVLLIALGIIGLLYGGVSWTRREKVVDIGSVQVTHEKHKYLPVPPVVGAICLVGGVSMLWGLSRRPRQT